MELCAAQGDLNLRYPCVSAPRAAFAHGHRLSPAPVFGSCNSNICLNVSALKTQCQFPALGNRDMKSSLMAAVQEGPVRGIRVQATSHTREMPF